MKKEMSTAGVVACAAIALGVMIGCIAVFVSKLRAHTDWGNGLTILGGVVIYLVLLGAGYGIGHMIDSDDPFPADLGSFILPIVGVVIALLAL